MPLTQDFMLVKNDAQHEIANKHFPRIQGKM